MTDDILDHILEEWATLGVVTIERAFIIASQKYPKIEKGELRKAWDEFIEVTGLDEEISGRKTWLRAQIEILQSLPHMHPDTLDWTNKIISNKSYVDYSLVLKILNEKKKELNELSK